MSILSTRTGDDLNLPDDINQLSIKALNKEGTNEISGMTEDTTPVSGDFFLMEDTASGELRKVNTDNMPGGGGGAVRGFAYLSGNAYVDENIVWIRFSQAVTLSKVRIGAVTAPTGDTLIVDVNYHATDPGSASTIFTTQGNRPTIAIAGHTADSGTPDVTSIADGGWLGISIDQVGSTLPGTGITIEIIGS